MRTIYLIIIWTMFMCIVGVLEYFLEDRYFLRILFSYPFAYVCYDITVKVRKNKLI